MKGFVVAGTATGVGKTTITAALVAALRRRGLAVQPFKCGPDYIDPAHHSVLAGRPSYNLDTWMMSRGTNLSIFRTAMHNADVAVVEGMMGLFDGVRGTSEEGSTAEIAKLLDLPVVLVADASNAARSIAALVKGFGDFDPQLRISGVILNGAAGPAHWNLLREAIAGIEVLGSFPKLPEAELAERHLGLVTAGERTWSKEQVRTLADAAQAHIDFDRLLGGGDVSQATSANAPAVSDLGSRDELVRIGIARDQAFSFYYESSLDALRAAGAELVTVSPLSDSSLPASLDGLYLGGGYPEIFAEQLAQNRPFLQSLKNFAASDRLIYAECAGLMYLAEELTTRDGRGHGMAGLLPLAIEMLDRLEGFGYTEVEVLEDCMVGTRGTRLRGHSFHYSRVTRTGNLDHRYRTRQVLTGCENREGYCTGNILASYVHLSFAASPGAASQFVRNCRQARTAV